MDATTEYLSEQCNTILERVVGPADSDKFANCVQAYVLTKCHRLLVDQSVADRFVCCFFFSFITLPKLCTIRCVSTYFSWASGYKLCYNLYNLPYQDLVFTKDVQGGFGRVISHGRLGSNLEVFLDQGSNT